MSSSCNARNKGSIHNKKSSRNSSSDNSSPANPKHTIDKKEKKDSVKKSVDERKREGAVLVQNGFKSRRIQGRAITKPTIGKFVSEVSRVNTNVQHEHVNWAKLQFCSTDDVHAHFNNYVIIIGLASGYQVFILLDNGSFEEIISMRNAPLKIGHLIPFKTNLRDRYSDQRPLVLFFLSEYLLIFFFEFFFLIALYSMENGTQMYTVNFLSLISGKIAHHINFAKAVIEIDSSSNCLLILMEGSITIFDHENFVQRLLIKLPPSPGSSYLANFSLSENLLAIADLQLIESLQSVGGSVADCIVDRSSQSQMLNTAKHLTKAVTSISESIVSSLGQGAPNKQENNRLSNFTGVVSVINLDSRLTKRCSNVSSNVHDHDCFAHFIAHSDSVIGHLMFGFGGQLLLTGSISATVFNVFQLHFHPKSSYLTSVQHIYTLNRGTTAAKVIESAFSFDNRWLTISTNHGTGHLFALNSYGGQTNSRTHGGKLMNREGKFERSTGIRVSERLNRLTRTNSKSGRTHPGVKNTNIARTVANCSCTSNPISLNSVAVLKQRIFSTENLCAWASDNTPSILQTAKRRKNSNGAVTREFGGILSAKFAKNSNCHKYPNAVESILVMNKEGVLTEYVIRTEVEKDISLSTKQSNNCTKLNPIGSVNESLPDKNSFDANQIANFIERQSSFKVKLSETLQWELTRSRNNADFELVSPPLPPENPLIKLNVPKKQKQQLDTKRKQKPSKSWLPFLEVITYAGPHRRLWLGPQFSFSIYTSNETPYESISCMSSTQIDGMQKCCPVLIENNSTAHNLLAHRPESSAARIICGSWSSEFDYKPLNEEISMVKDKIEDAMKESNEKGKECFAEEEENDDCERNTHKNEDKDLCMMLSGIDL